MAAVEPQGAGMEIIVVGEPGQYNRSCERWGNVTLSPPIFGMSSRPGLTTRQTNIMTAMWEAVRASEPGDLILQDDVDLYKYPWEPVDRDAIRVLTGQNLDPSIRGWHCCPQAFIVGSEKTRQKLIDLWDPAREGGKGENACLAWAPIPKQIDYIAAMHWPYETDGPHDPRR